MKPLFSIPQHSFVHASLSPELQHLCPCTNQTQGQELGCTRWFRLCWLHKDWRPLRPNAQGYCSLSVYIFRVLACPLTQGNWSNGRADLMGSVIGWSCPLAALRMLQCPHSTLLQSSSGAWAVHTAIALATIMLHCPAFARFSECPEPVLSVPGVQGCNAKVVQDQCKPPACACVPLTRLSLLGSNHPLHCLFWDTCLLPSPLCAVWCHSVPEVPVGWWG